MKLKKCFLFLVLFVAFNFIGTSNAFSDVARGHWAYEEIQLMKNREVISGFQDGTFRPENEVTREQFATILVKSLDLKSNKKYIDFEDIEWNRWSRADINTASLYLTGYEFNGKMYFRPKDFAVREDMAVAVVKARNLENEKPNYNVLNRFKDKDLISDGVKKYVAIAVEHGFMKGNPDGTFNPLGGLTRAEITVLMCNVMEEKFAVEDKVFEEELYSVFSYGDGLKVKGNGTYEVGEKVKLTITAKDGYRFERVQRTSNVGVDQLDIQRDGDDAVIIFRMPKNDVEIELYAKEKDDIKEYNVIAYGNGLNIKGIGKYTVGEDVEIIVSAKDGYEYERIQMVSGVGIDKIDTETKTNGAILRFRMPSRDVELELFAVKNNRYDVSASGNGLRIRGTGTYEVGADVEIGITQEDGYKFEYVKVYSGIGADETYVIRVNNGAKIRFKMPSRNVKLELYASESSRYNVKIVGDGIYETINTYDVGERIEITVRVEKGYKYERIQRLSGVGINDVKNTAVSNGVKLNFVMPSRDVELEIFTKSIN